MNKNWDVGEQGQTDEFSIINHRKCESIEPIAIVYLTEWLSEINYRIAFVINTNITHSQCK